MSIEHKSRTGKIYYLHTKTTRAGNPGYFFSTDPDGALAPTVPDGYKIYENVDGQVFLRKNIKPVIMPEELALVEKALNLQGPPGRFRADVKKKTIVVYEASGLAGLDNLLSEWGINWTSDADRLRFAHYKAMLRFTLIDKNDRIFVAERFCFRGSVDDWIPLGGSNSLAAHVRRFVKHLGLESFYDLS